MAQNTRFLFFNMALLAMAILFYSCESRGSQNTNTNNQQVLPFDLIIDPDPDFKGGFTIREADGFALIGKGVSYRDIDLQIEVLVGYGVQKTSLAAEVINVEGETKFIKVVKQVSPSKQPFTVSFVTEREVKDNNAYQWVNFGKNE